MGFSLPRGSRAGGRGHLRRREGCILNPRSVSPFKGTDVTASKTSNLSKHIHHTGRLCFPIWCDIQPRINQHALETKIKPNQNKKPQQTNKKINTSKLFQPPAQYLLIVKIHLQADKWQQDFTLEESLLLMDSNRAVAHVLLSPFSQGHLSKW